MKKVIIGLLSFASISSFAFHPEDGDILSNIGIGTELAITKDINFKPNNQMIRLGNSNCYIDVKDPKGFDRVLKAGRVLKVTDTSSVYSTYYETRSQVLEVDNLHIENITCTYMKDTKGRKTRATIGYFRNVTSGIIEIKLADPLEI